MTDKIQKAYNNNAFKKYIDYIRLPFFKNFVKNTEITFDYPITVLVGENGTGKSSILKALFGCTEGRSIGQYWFSTKVDNILESNDQKNCLIYNYKSNSSTDHEYEVLLTRIQRSKSYTKKADPEYWETSRPLVNYGMKRFPDGSRKPKIKMNVVYIDFHSLLSPFITYQYLLANQNSRIDTKNYLRRKSTNLFNAIKQNKILGPGKQNEKPVELSEDELKYMSQILGKKYTSGLILEHKFFKVWGTSVYLCTKENLEYSDAFAGSGETAVAILIHRLINAEPKSLILLDEPEISLHPGAQKQLFEFLKSICLKKQHQIVISTHSVEFLKGLPSYAIKTFLPVGNKIQVFNENNISSAFYSIGANIDQIQIFVEDTLAANILTAIAKSLGDDINAQLNIKILPGGAESIQKAIGGFFSAEINNVYFVLDGDKDRPTDNYKNIPLEEVTFERLTSIIEQKTDVSLSKQLNMNSNETEEIRKNRCKDYLKYRDSNVYFLPLNQPEEIIWDDSSYKELLKVNGIPLPETTNSLEDFKINFRKLAEFIFGKATKNEIDLIEIMFINAWISKDSNEKKEIEEIILSIIAK